MKLPGVHGSNGVAANAGKASIPAKKPIRQQPSGLKMRFRPIGFGDGETGKIGSSSSSVDGSSGTDEEQETTPATKFRRPITVALNSSEGDESSEDSDSDEKSSLPDMERAEAPPLPTKPAMKENKAQSAVPSSQEVINGSLKRKHSHKEVRNAKHSLSRPSSFGDRKLKRLKKPQIESQRSLGDKASVLIEPRPGSSKHAQKSEIVSSQDTPIRPPKSASLPHTSPSSRPKDSLGKDGSPEIVKSKKRDRSEPATPFRKVDVSLQDLTKAPDPSLTGEERRKKLKKLKNKE